MISPDHDRGPGTHPEPAASASPDGSDANSAEARLLAVLDGIAECFYAIDRNWRITSFNRQAEAFFGLRRADVVGRVIWEAFQVRAVPQLEEIYRAAMDGVASEPMSFASPARPDRWLEGSAFPLPDGVGVAFRDVTDARADELALRRREAELAHVQRIAGVGGLEVEFDRGFSNRRSPEYLRLHGLPPEASEETHEAWVARIHPDDRVSTEAHFRSTVKGGDETYSAEYRIIRPSDGETRWILASAEIERDARGRAIRLVGAHRDITERKRAEGHQQLLINELNHRVKNTLATVQSVAAQSLRGAASPSEGWASFEARLMALSRAHDILTRENWEGADLRDIVEQATAPYRDDDARVRVSGQRVRLAPNTALALAMTLQELATNAVKHGALSTAGGSVDISWILDERDGRKLRLTWREAGGPPVAPPSRRGFGTRLIERSLVQELDGAVSLDFAPSGVVCLIDAPIGAISHVSSDSR